MGTVVLHDEGKEQLAALGVTAVVLFGSRATGDAGPTSDYDIGVLLDEGGVRQRAGDYHRYYTSLYDVFAEQLGDLYGLDVVFLDRAPLELRRHVARYGMVLMEHERGTVARFNDSTNMLYADFEPYRIMMNRAVLERAQ